MIGQHRFKMILSPNRRRRNLGKCLRREKGITGLETAIILIAFVVVASVFAYTVLIGGIYSSQKSKQSIQEGVNAIETAKPMGSIRAYANEINIDDCDANWTTDGDNGARGTPSLDTSTYKEGEASVSIVCSGTYAAGDDQLAYHAISPALNLTTATKVRCWVYTSQTTSRGDLQLILYDAYATEDKEEELDFPAIGAGTWTHAEFTLMAPADCTSIDGVGIEAEDDPGTMTIKIDDVEIAPYVKQLEVFVTTSMKGWDIDLTPPYEVLTQSHGELAANADGGSTLISYTDQNISTSECAWTVQFLGKHTDDYILEDDEIACIKVWFVNCEWDSSLSSLAWALGASGGAFCSDNRTIPGASEVKQDFKLQILPAGGAPYAIEASIPASMQTIMYLQ